jgi:hypothetical protein
MNIDQSHQIIRGIQKYESKQMDVSDMECLIH